MKDKKIAVFGCKSTTKFLIENLLKNVKISNIITISPSKGKRFEVADYYDLTKFSQKYNIDLYQSSKYSLKDPFDIENIRSLNIDLAFVAGWQRIIPEEILNSISTGAFGMHGSSMDLPLGRGRSPMNWSIIEGRKYFYTNLFKYDSGIDSGDILDTNKFPITEFDTAETMHFKNTLSMCDLIKKNLNNLLSGDFKLKKQKKINPTYYPKRTPNDSLIDWERDIFYLQRFIRAVTKPFNGAYTYNEKKKIIIYNAQILDTEYYGREDELNGKVIETFNNGKFIVKVNGGILLVNEYEGRMPIKNSLLSSGNENIKNFELNKHGYYDIA